MSVPAEVLLTGDGRTGELLVVDGDSATRDLLCDLLAGAGFPALGVDLDALGPDPPGSSPAAIVVHDRGPGFRRRDLVATLRARYPETPLILIGEPGGGERVSADGHGVTGYLEKPFDVPDLLALVWRTVGPIPTRRASRPSRRSRRMSPLRAGGGRPPRGEPRAPAPLRPPDRTAPAA